MRDIERKTLASLESRIFLAQKVMKILIKEILFRKHTFEDRGENLTDTKT